MKYTLVTCLLLSTGSSWAKDEFLNIWGAVLIGKGYGSLMAEAVTSAQNLRSASIEFSRSIGAARKQFCNTFPNKPGHEQAAQKFARELAGKDFYYLAMTLILGDSPQAKVIEAISGGMDGGIPKGAQREFAIWIGGMQEYFRQSGGGVPSMNDVLGALQATESKQQKYRLARDVAEIERCGFKLPPQIYAITLFNRYIKLNSNNDAFDIYNGMVNAFGEQNVISAASAVSSAPKDGRGDLIDVESFGLYPLGRARTNDMAPPGLNPIYEKNPYLVMVALLSNQDPRSYLLGLIERQNKGHDWMKAIQTYNLWVSIYGEDAVLSASDKVRTAQKTISDGIVYNQSSLGALKSEPYLAFQDILAVQNLKGYVYSVIAFGKNLDSTDAIQADYNRLVAAHGEQAVLNAARTMLQDGYVSATGEFGTRPGTISCNTREPYACLRELLNPSSYTPPRTYDSTDRRAK